METASSVRLSASGFPLHALERNPAGQPAVLFLHGWLDHAHSFDWVCRELPAAWHQLALDFRGHGDSGHLPAGSLYHFSDYLADVDAAANHLSPGPVHLIGHSMGGAVAMAYAAARPEKVKSLTAIENLGPFGGAAEAAGERLGNFLSDLSKPARRRLYLNLEDAVARVKENNSSFSEEIARHLTRYGTRPTSGGIEFTFDPALRRRSAIVYDEAQLLSVCRSVKSPMQVIHGTEGMTFDDAEMKTRLAALGNPAVRAVRGGHHVHLDSPGEVARILQGFIASHS